MRNKLKPKWGYIIVLLVVIFWAGYLIGSICKHMC